MGENKSFTTIKNCDIVSFEKIKQNELLKIALEATRLITESENNKLIALDLLTSKVSKLGLPTFIAYGFYTGIADIAVHQRTLKNSSLKNSNKLELIEEDEEKIKNLIIDIISLSNIILNETDNFFREEYKKIEDIAYEKMKKLINSFAISKIFENDTDICKEDLRNYIENSLNLPTVIATGILTELFYSYFKNINRELPENIFEENISNINISYINYLQNFAKEVSMALAKLATS